MLHLFIDISSLIVCYLYVWDSSAEELLCGKHAISEHTKSPGHYLIKFIMSMVQMLGIAWDD